MEELIKKQLLEILDNIHTDDMAETICALLSHDNLCRNMACDICIFDSRNKLGSFIENNSKQPNPFQNVTVKEDDVEKVNKIKLKKLSQFIREYPEHLCDNFFHDCDDDCASCPFEESRSESFSKYLNGLMKPSKQ